MPVTRPEDILAAAQAGQAALAAQLAQHLLLQGPAPPALPSYPAPPPQLDPPVIRPRPRPLVAAQPTPRELQATVSASEKPVRVCYGNVRVGADLIWVGRSISNNRFVFHLRWCWGEINSITKVQLANEDLPGTAVQAHYTGTTTQTADATLSALIGGYTDTLIYSIPGGGTRGIAYSVIQIPYDDMPDSLDFTCELEGLKILDTRTSTTVYSTNPALQAYDFLTSELYGPGWEITDGDTDDLADMCDTLVSGQKRFESHYVLDRSQNIQAHVEAMVGAASAFLVPEDTRVFDVPRYKFAKNRSATSAGTFDLEAVSIDRSEVIRPINRASQPNRVRVRYIDTSIEPWAEAFAEQETAAVTAGTEAPRITTLNTPYIHSHRIANRLAVEYLNGQQLPEFDVEWIHADDGIRLQRGDVITLNKIPGFSASEYVRVLRKSLVRHAGGYFWRIMARQYQAGEFSNAVVDQTVPPAASMGDAFNPADPTSLVLTERIWSDDAGRYFSVIEIAFDGSVSEYARNYRVLVKIGTDTIFEEVVAHQGNGVAHDVTTPQVAQDDTYTVTVYTISTVGAISTGASDTVTPTGRGTVPSNVTNLEAIEYKDWIELEWDNVLSPGDTAHRIKRGSQSDTWATASDLDETVFMNRDAISEDTIVWRDHDAPSGDVEYFVKVISFEGLESAAADSVEITILDPKGSRAFERPRIPKYIDEAEWLDIDFDLYTYFNSNLLGGLEVFTGTVDDQWETALNVSGSGVLEFCGFAFLCAACSGDTTALGSRITLDGVVIWEQLNELGTGSDISFSLVPVGGVFTSPDSTTVGEDIADFQFHYLPYNHSLKIETYAGVTGASSITNYVGYKYHET